MAGNEHLMFAQEDDWGTYVAPEIAIPVTSASINPTQPQMQNDDTGGGRARRAGGLGEKTVGGPIVTKLYSKGVPKLIRGMYGERDVNIDGTGFKNKFLPDDDVVFDSYSFQKRYKAAVAESIRGAMLNGYTISARSKEFAVLETRWVAKDTAMSGGTWADGSAAPAVVDPPAYPASQPDALKFTQGEMRTGGTVALTTGEITWAGGASRCEFDNVSAEINNNLATDAFGVCLGDPTVQSIDQGRREISLKFEPNFDTVEGEFYNAWLEGEDLTVQLFFQSAQTYDTGKPFKWAWTFPLVRTTSAPNPELNAAYGLKRSTVEAIAYHDETLGYDHGLVIWSSEDLIAPVS